MLTTVVHAHEQLIHINTSDSSIASLFGGPLNVNVRCAQCRELAMTHTLVPSDRVETASVYGRDDTLIGTIERLMLQKKSGVVAYAVVRCGGLIKGEVHHYPVPWDSLKYDVMRKAYTTNLTLEELRSGPSELDGEAFDWGDRSKTHCHPQYWTV